MSFTPQLNKSIADNTEVMNTPAVVNNLNTFASPTCSGAPLLNTPEQSLLNKNVHANTPSGSQYTLAIRVQVSQLINF